MFFREVADFALSYDIERTIQEYERLIEADPRSAPAHFDLALFCHSSGRIERALSEFARALELDPEMSWAHVRLGEIYIARNAAGDDQRTRRHAEAAAQLGNRALLDLLERYSSPGS
jgi:tetratricopeptide (TPR) repeat protein